MNREYRTWLGPALSAFVAAILILSGCGKPAELSEAEEMIRGMQKNFAYLINHHAQGKTKVQPWAGFYWPYAKDGIASSEFSATTWRWLWPKRESPTSKYDQARGGGSAADAWEKKNHGRGVRGVEGWWGHCNGWSAAASLFPEPRQPVTVGNVTFTVGDIKALLTEASMEAEADFYGNRVDTEEDASNHKYNDVVPAQYFLVLANYMGIAEKPVLIDRFTGREVWNQPLAGYRFEYPKREDYLGALPDSNGVFRILLTSRIWWLRDDVHPDILTPSFKFQNDEAYDSRELRMELWLDGPVVFDVFGRIISSGNVFIAHEGERAIGGAWRTGSGHINDAWPDYMWVAHTITSSTGYANPELDLQWLKDKLIPKPSPSPAPSTRGRWR